jgi:hypothetical protein
MNQVCDHEICIRLVYAGASSASELVARAAKPVLPLLYVAMAVQVVWAFAVPLAALRTWAPRARRELELRRGSLSVLGPPLRPLRPRLLCALGGIHYS